MCEDGHYLNKCFEVHSMQNAMVVCDDMAVK